MLRDFCLNCGASLVTPGTVFKEGTDVCVCGAPPELLTVLTEQEQAHLPKYTGAKPLTEGDLERQVWCDGRAMTVAQLIANAYVGHAIRACLPRVGEREIVQLVYIKRLGSMLFTWPFCEVGSFAGPHWLDRMRPDCAREGTEIGMNPGPPRRERP
jgi:hypothetical protein